MYLAVIEQYPDSIETLESAAGAIQNLAACHWKVSVGKVWNQFLCQCLPSNRFFAKDSNYTNFVD